MGLKKSDLLIGHEYFHTKCKSHAAFQIEVDFFRSFVLQRKTSTNHVTSVPKQQHQQQWVTGPLSVSLGTKQCLTDDHKNNNRKDNAWQSFAD